MTSRILTVAAVAALLVGTVRTSRASAYSDEVMEDNPVAYYHLNETSLTQAVNSGTGGTALNGNYVGYGAAVEGTGPINVGQVGPRPGNPSGTSTITGMDADNHAIHSGVNFTTFPTASGDNPRVEVPDFPGNPLDIGGQLTLEAWIYRDPQSANFNTNNEGIVDKYQGAGSSRSYELVLQADNSSLRFIISRFGVYEQKYDLGTAANVVPEGEWTHVAATYIPSTRMAIFVNGELKIERTDPNGIAPFIFNSDAPLWIGTQLNINNNDPLRNGNTAFEGRLDEVAVYDTALSDTRIMDHYRAAASAAPPVLAGDYNSNGVVDAADYAVWRDNQNTNIVLPNDLIGGTIGPLQYAQWKTHFGATLGSGSIAVPEPAAMCLLLCGSLLLISSARKSSCR